jgi:hypothetical protein
MEFLSSPGKDNLMRAFKLWTLANENLTLTDEMQDFNRTRWIGFNEGI